MKFKKTNTSHLEGFAELIKAANPSQNMCICRDILSNPENQKVVLEGLRAYAAGSRRSYSLSGHDLYLDDAKKSQELHDKLKSVFELEERKNEEN